MTNPQKSDLRRYLIERDDRTLKEIISEARAAGRLKELSSALLTAVLEAPEFAPNVNKLLDDLFASPESSPRQAQAQSQPQQLTADEPHNSGPAYSKSTAASFDDAGLSMQRMLESAKRELDEVEDSENVARRTELLQLCSVLKYVSGNRLGLVELSEYQGGLRPLAFAMIALYHTTPESSLREDRRILQRLTVAPEERDSTLTGQSV